MVRPKKISDEEVLEIARRCFIEKGPNVSTREIAEKTGLSQPALFKRFKTKEELFIAAIATKKVFTKVVSFIGWIHTHPTKDDFQPQVEELLFRMWDVMTEILPRLIALHTQRTIISADKLFSLMKKPPPVKVYEAVTKFVVRAQQNGQVRKDVDPSVLAMNLMGSVQGRVFFSRILALPDIENDDAYIAKTARNFCQGILTQE